MAKKRLILFSVMTVLLFSPFTILLAALSNGYIVCGAYSGKSTVLIDKHGNIVHTWEHPDLNGYSTYLLENGNLLRTAQVANSVKVPANAAPLQGIVQEVDLSGNIVWTYQLANDTCMLHHDVKPMPNGNVLAISFEVKSREDALALGIDSALFSHSPWREASLLAEKIIEIDPKAEGGPKIVWEWHILDHIIPKEQAAEHPELFSGSLGPLFMGQWVHLNGLDYCPKRDLIVFSSRVFSEVYVIDHSTTTEEAATHAGGNHGKGGDLLYRWGRPANYQTAGESIVHVLHCPTWIPEGYAGESNILFFHNNSNKDMVSLGPSEIIEIAPPVDTNGNFQYIAGSAFGPNQPTWKYAPADSFHSKSMSSAFRLQNGNTLIHEAYQDYGKASGPDMNTYSRMREVTKEGQIVWNYIIPLKSDKGYNPAKVMYYPSSYIGIENLLQQIGMLNRDRVVQNRKLRDRPCINRVVGRINFSHVAGSEISIFTVQGEKVELLRSETDRFSYTTRHLPAGLYLVKVKSRSNVVTSRIINVVE